MDDLSATKAKLQELGEKIAAKIAELDRQGILHGDARIMADDLRVRHVRLATMAEERESGSVHPGSASVLAAEAETLRLAFDRWVAEIDRGY